MINRTYIVNLKRREDKKNHMENEFVKLQSKNINLNHVFFEAVDGNDPQLSSKFKFKIPNWFDPMSGKVMTNGEVGCALSHYSIWQEIIKEVENNNLNSDCKVLIVEDDVIFLDNFLTKLEEYTTKETKLMYDMLYVHRKPLNLQAEVKISPHINSVKKSYWTCGYILTYTGAKKLVAANYLDNLIPVDEFLPIMYGCRIFGFEKLFESCEKLDCYAVCPSLLKLTNNAFYDSETFHSQPFLKNDYYKFDVDKEFTVVYCGPRFGNSYRRFVQYCQLYGIPVIFLGKDNDDNNNSTIAHSKLLSDKLEEWINEDDDQTSTRDNISHLTEEHGQSASMETESVQKQKRIKNRLILVISIDAKKTDFCWMFPLASPQEIVEKFSKNSDGHIITYAKNQIHNNVTIMFGWANKIKELLSAYGKLGDESYIPMSMLLAFNTAIKNDTFNDDQCQIFHVLETEKNITYDHKASRVIYVPTKTEPCFMIATTRRSVLLLNRIENYTGINWNENYGYQIPANNILPLQPKIYLSFNLGGNKNILKIINNLNYPKDLLTIKINRVGHSKNNNELEIVLHQTDEDLYANDIKYFLNSTDAEYYFFINNFAVITNPKTINELLTYNKDVIAPFIRRGNDPWTNFWGDLDDKGFYARSFDYMDIINGKRQGCWNVPYVMGAYLIKRQVLESHPNIFTENKEMDPDMRLCHNLRSADIFMYVTNMSNYGYIEEVVNDESDNNFIIEQVKGEISIYSLFEQRMEWEKKYLHPEYYENKKTLEKLKCIELCNDIYSFPLFSETFCREIIMRMEAYGRWSKGKDNHNDPRLGRGYYENVPTVDIHFFEIKWDKHWSDIVASYIAPLVKILYSNYKTKDVHLGFVVKYHYKNQSSLAPHHDASTYTVNIALNKGNGIDYEGGGCRFIRQNYVLKNQLPGMCCIHVGRLTAYHEGLPITAGTRYILVSFIN